MAESCTALVDPRIRRTRLLLQQALQRLLETTDFEKISVQEIAEAATVNRATFYDHYSDKFALLECMVGSRFQELLAARKARFDSGCTSALRAFVLGVCDYLAEMPGLACGQQRQLEPHLETAVIAVVRSILLEGMQRHPSAQGVPAEMRATTISWAICGAAKEWVRTPNRVPSEAIADTVMLLIAPMMGATSAPTPDPSGAPSFAASPQRVGM